MRYFILSDIHGNKEALDAVLADMGSRFAVQLTPERTKNDKVVFLGDVLGYGPNPNEVMEKMWEIADEKVIGNHDEAVYWHRERGTDYSRWSPTAAWGVHWTAEQLSADNAEKLKQLMQEMCYRVHKGNLVFAHAEPGDPEAMEYIQELRDAKMYFFSYPRFEKSIGFSGHIHIPQLYERKGTDVKGQRIYFRPADMYKHPDLWRADLEKAHADPWLCVQESPDRPLEKKISLEQCDSALVIVPAVGQPRDGFWYAGYAVYNNDDKSVIMRRIPYAVGETQKKLRAIPSCPPRTYERLETGF